MTVPCCMAVCCCGRYLQLLRKSSLLRLSAYVWPSPDVRLSDVSVAIYFPFAGRSYLPTSTTVFGSTSNVHCHKLCVLVINWQKIGGMSYWHKSTRDVCFSTTWHGTWNGSSEVLGMGLGMDRLRYLWTYLLYCICFEQNTFFNNGAALNV